MKKFIKKKSGYTQLVDFDDATLSHTKVASSKLTTGYTLIETMISVSVFLIVVMSGMNALLNANLLYQKSQDVRSILDNLSFIMEDISRNLRTGYDYQCFSVSQDLSSAFLGAPRSCARGYAIAFEASGGNPASFSDQWVYYVSNGKIFKSTDGLGSPGIQLTSNEVVIDSVSGFSVLGAESPSLNTQQPLVGIRLIGSISTMNITTPFFLQTSISQRLLVI